MRSPGFPAEIFLQEIIAMNPPTILARICQVISTETSPEIAPELFPGILPWILTRFSYGILTVFLQRFATLILLGITPEIHPETPLVMPLGISSKIAIGIVMNYKEIVFKHIETCVEVSS